MPLPPKPPDEPDEDEAPPIPLLPELELDEPDDPEEMPALPRLPAEVEPALRLAVLDALLGTEDTLFPTEEALTALATDADFAVAALTCAEAFDADLLVAATPPPVPDDCPETAERDASSAVLREAVCCEAIVDGLEPPVAGGGE